MAIKVYDGFDHYNSDADFLARSGFLQWQNLGSGPNSPSRSYITGFEGDGKALRISGLGLSISSSLTSAVLGQRVASAFIGVRITTELTAGFTVVFWDTTPLTGPAVQISVLFNQNNYSIAVYRGSYGSGGTLLGATGNNVWAGDVANFVEVWPVIDPAAGSVEVKVNGEILLNITGVNTQSSSNTWWDACGISPEHIGFSGFVNIDVDDFYYADTVVGPGSYPANTPLGDLHVFTKFAIGNASVQWTPLANTNWQEVSETAMDSDVSYNFTSTAGQEDLLNFAPLESTISQIVAVQITGAYRKDDAGMRVVKQALKSNTTEVYGASYSLPDTKYAYFTDLFTLDPNTSASWTLTGANAISAGYNLVS